MVNRLGARSWTLTNELGHPAGADKSAMGAINRPLRRLRRRFWYILVHVFISIIWALLHTSSDFLEFFTRESSHCLGTHAALCDGAKDQACRCLIIGSLCYHH